jgi:site-specific DNA-methyltransferase (adenine-specific)
MEAGKPYTKKAVTDGDGKNYGKFSRAGTVAVNEGTRYPRSVIKVSNNNHGSLHPTQKPVALWEYLIRTYTNEGNTVLDNCCGSGTTGVACRNTNRHFIQMDISKEYCAIAERRLRE